MEKKWRLLEFWLKCLTVFMAYIAANLYSYKVDFLPWGNSQNDGLYLIFFLYLIPIYILLICFSIYKNYTKYITITFLILIFSFISANLIECCDMNIPFFISIIALIISIIPFKEDIKHFMFKY